jgi:hypothetical protein
MTLILQPNVFTRRSAAEVISAFQAAHVRIFAEPATETLVEVMTCWSAFETWLWHSMHDDNLTNMRGTWHGNGTTFKGASEIINGKEVFLPPGPDNVFRAYIGPTSLVDSAEDTMRFVGTASNPAARPNRYQDAWDAAHRGDLEGFVNGLAFPKLPGIERVPGFFTANPRVYLAGVQHCAVELQPDFSVLESVAHELPTNPSNPPPDPPPSA